MLLLCRLSSARSSPSASASFAATCKTSFGGGREEIDLMDSSSVARQRVRLCDTFQGSQFLPAGTVTLCALW